MANIITDADEWSEASKRSVSYWFTPRPYIDIPYLCWRCRVPAVFTAEDQKHAYEVRKAHVWQQRVLCVPCHAARCRLDREARACRQRWAADRHSLLRDAEFLRHWLAVLEARAGHGARADHAGIAMLRRLTAAGG